MNRVQTGILSCLMVFSMNVLAATDFSHLSDHVYPRHQSQVRTHGGQTRDVVLLLHGLYESPAYLKGLSDYFYSQGMNVVTPILPGHWHEDPYEADLATEADFLAAAEVSWLEAKKWGERVTLVGFSTGGLLAVHLNLQHPNAFRALILFAPALQIQKQVIAAAWAGKNLGVDGNLFRGQPEADLVPYFSPTLGWTVYQAIALMWTRLRNLGGATWNREGVPSHEDRSLSYRRLETPTFLMLAEQDHLLDNSEAEHFFASISSSNKVRYVDPMTRHENLTKSEIDQTAWNAGHFNQDFAGLLQKVELFLHGL